jgi:hypothetical protein
MKKLKLQGMKRKQITGIIPLVREHMRLVIGGYGGAGVVVITGPGPDDPGPK